MNDEPAVLRPAGRLCDLDLENLVTVKPRYESLDILRGVLALWIVFQHVCFLTNGGRESWLDRSQLVVNVFFVLAGFSFGLGKPKPYGEYVLGRIRRLFPIYWICLSFAFLLAGHDWTTLALDMTGLQGLVPVAWWPRESSLPTGWFVSCIFCLYLIAPFLNRLKDAFLWAACALSLLVLAHPINWRLYTLWDPFGGFFPQKAYLFIIGMLLFRYWPKFGSWRFGVAAQPLIWLGSVSYALFLVHWPILSSIYHAKEGHAFNALALVGVPLSILAAWFLHRVVK